MHFWCGTAEEKLQTSIFCQNAGDCDEESKRRSKSSSFVYLRTRLLERPLHTVKVTIIGQSSQRRPGALMLITPFTTLLPRSIVSTIHLLTIIVTYR